MIAKRKRFHKDKESIIQNVALTLLFFGIFFGVIGLLVYNNLNIQGKRSELDSGVEALQSRIAELQAQKIELEASGLKIDSVEYQEGLLREKGLYKKPGEEVITILLSDEQEGMGTEKEKRTWWNPLTWF